MGLFDAIRQIADAANSAPQAADPSDADAARHVRYHRTIVLVGGRFAALGAVFGLATSLAVAGDATSGGDIVGLVQVPVMYGAGGFVFGTSVMCLVAPQSFLASPAGRPWMKLIGTRSVAVARIACLLFGLIVTAPLVGIGLLIALGK